MVRTEPGECPLCGPQFDGEEVARGRDFEYDTTGEQEFRFVRCRGCGVIVLDPRPADDEIAGLYPDDYGPYKFDELPALVRKGRDYVQRRKVDVIRRHAKPDARVIDVGCGAGAFLRLLRSQGEPSWRLAGWDFPGPHLEHVRRDGFDVISAPIERPDVPRDTDVFVLNQVIEHFARPAEVVAMLADGLAPGGCLIMETPDTDGLDARWFGDRHWGGYHIPRHLVLFNEATLRTLVERAGLSVVETAHLSSPAFWVQSLHHRALERNRPRLASLCVIDNLPLVAAFSAFDAACAKFRPTSNQRIVAMKPTG